VSAQIPSSGSVNTTGATPLKAGAVEGRAAAMGARGLRALQVIDICSLADKAGKAKTNLLLEFS
jgi:hypothetical protein